MPNPAYTPLRSTPRCWNSVTAGKTHARYSSSHASLTVALLYQAIDPPVINGVRKPRKPGGQPAPLVVFCTNLFKVIDDKNHITLTLTRLPRLRSRHRLHPPYKRHQRDHSQQLTPSLFPRGMVLPGHRRRHLRRRPARRYSPLGQHDPILFASPANIWEANPVFLPPIRRRPTTWSSRELRRQGVPERQAARAGRVHSSPVVDCQPG